MQIEDESFQTSILYWIGVLEGMANQQFIRRLGGGKSAVSRWRTLSILSEIDGIAINDLARHTQIERTALSHLLTQMEAEELVSRRAQETDRRVIGVHLLPKGQALFRTMLPIRRAVFRDAARDIAPEELEGLMRTVRRLIDNLQAEECELARMPTDQPLAP